MGLVEEAGRWILIAVVLAGCGTTTRLESDMPADDPARISRVPMTTGALADTYAGMVESAILDGFGVQSFAQACPQPDWVCAIDRVEAPQAGSAFVTLRDDWEAVLPESAWSGPPAGVGCFKWGELIGRNVVAFSEAAGVRPLPRVTVYKADGSRC